MNTSSPTSDLRTVPGEDSLDRLMSDFFKRQVRQPWPPAPFALPLAAEPSLVAAARTTAELPSKQTTPGRRVYDPSARARYTLAVSAAVLLGTCWCLSNGFRTADRPAPTAPAAPFLGVFPDSGANDPEALKERRKDKAINGDAAPVPKIQLP